MGVGTSKGVGGRGLSPYLATDCDATISATEGEKGHIKSTGGRLYYLDLQSKNAADTWVQIYDEAGAITVGTTTAKLSILVPASDGTLYSGRTVEMPVSPIKFDNSIKFACTTSVDGNTAPSSDIIVNALYK